MNKTIEQLKNIAALVPFFGGFIILYGVMKAVFYYGVFNIDIISFLTFGEFVTYFMKDIQLVLFYFISFLVGLVFLDRLLRQTTTPSEENDRFLKLIKKGMILGVILGFVSLLAISISTGDWNSFFRAATLFCIVFLVLKLSNEPRVSFMIICFSALLIMASFGSISRAKRVKKGMYVGLNFRIKGTEMTSDSVNYFIGKTENYIFYYRSKERKTEVYKVGDLESMVIPNN